MTKRETRATIDELAAECNRLTAENEVLHARLAAVTHCLGQLVGVSSGLHAWLIDEYFQCKQLEEEPRKGKSAHPLAKARGL